MGKKEKTGLEPSAALDVIEGIVYEMIKPYGFKKYGRTLHRFVSGDISQVIHFQLGQAYRGETHLLWVNIGIRVPECVLRCFAPEENRKKHYHEYECNIRSRLGTVEGGAESCYDFRRSTEPIADDVLRQIRESVLPGFEALNSRDAILVGRRDYPWFDIMNNHLMLLDEAMIFGRRGEREKAAEVFNQYYRFVRDGQSGQKEPNAIRNHLQYLDGLATELDIKL